MSKSYKPASAARRAAGLLPVLALLAMTACSALSTGKSSDQDLAFAASNPINHAAYDDRNGVK